MAVQRRLIPIPGFEESLILDLLAFRSLLLELCDRSSPLRTHCRADHRGNWALGQRLNYVSVVEIGVIKADECREYTYHSNQELPPSYHGPLCGPGLDRTLHG